MAETRAVASVPADILGAKNISDIANKKTGAVNAAEIQNRRFISVNSGSGASSREISFGSSAIPHFGQEPGPSWTISGCIGQVYSAEDRETGADRRGGRVSCLMSLVSGLRYSRGSAANFALQLGLQK